MGTKSNEEIKFKILEELKRIFSENKEELLPILDRKLSLDNLSEEIRRKINDNSEIKEFYNETKKELLEKKFLELIIQFQLIKEENDYEKQKEQLQNDFITCLIEKINDQKEKERLNNLINQKAEENKKQLELLNSLLDKKMEEEKAEVEKENEQLKLNLINHKQKIENTNKEIEKIKSEADEKNGELLSFMKAYQLQLNEMQIENEKKLKENEERLKREFEEKFGNKMKQELERKLKEAKDEMERQKAKEKWDLFEKKVKAGKMFENEINIIKNKKIKEILYLFQNKEDKICLDEISTFFQSEGRDSGGTKNNLLDLIEDLIKTEKMKDSANYHLNKFLKDCQHEIKNIEHLNIILVGPSGVGKSTLINALLKLNLQTGFGAPQTEKIEYHTSEVIPYLRLADSKGIEKDKNADVEIITKSVENFITEQIIANDPDKYIHCVWYCFTGTRLEGSELKVLDIMSKQYTADKLPVIIVYTRAISKNDINLANRYIHNELNLANEFIEVLAQKDSVNIGDKEIEIPPKNLNKLIEITLEKSMQSINSSCFEGKLNEIKNKISENLDTLMKKLKRNLVNKVNNSLLKLNEKSEIQKFYEETKNMILEIVFCFFFLNSEIQFDKDNGYKVKLNDEIQYELSEASRNKIDIYIGNYFTYIIESLKKKLNININAYAEDLVKEIIEKQFEFNRQNKNLLEFNFTKNDLLNTMNLFIKDEIYNKIKFIVLKNAINFLINPLIELFGQNFYVLYTGLMRKEEFVKNAKDSIKISFDNLKTKINEYYDKKNIIDNSNNENNSNKKEGNLEDIIINKINKILDED